MGTSDGNRLVAFTRVICPIGCDAADVLIGRDLVQKFWQHGSISDVAAGDLDRPNLQCFFVNSNMYFPRDAPFGATRPPETHACMCERDACGHSTRLLPQL